MYIFLNDKKKINFNFSIHAIKFLGFDDNNSSILFSRMPSANFTVNDVRQCVGKLLL